MNIEETVVNSYNIANLMTITDYAKKRGVSRQTIYNWIEDKQIKTVDLLGRTYVDKSSAKK